LALLVVASVATPALGRAQPVAASAPCADSVTSNYTVHTCFAAPADNTTVTGVVTVHVTTQVTVGTIKVKRTVFSLDTGYLLTDFAAQSVSNGTSNWHFDLPSYMWVDGAHTLSVVPLLGNNQTTGAAAS